MERTPRIRVSCKIRDYVGLYVSLEETSICVIDESGHKVWQGKSSSEPTAIAKKVKLHAPETAKVGFETGPLCTWHWHELQGLGLPVVCLDVNGGLKA